MTHSASQIGDCPLCNIIKHLKVKQNSRVKARLFSIVVKQKILELISSLPESFCPETGSIDLDDRRIMHHAIQYG